jgi:hypothetical protein
MKVSTITSRFALAMQANTRGKKPSPFSSRVKSLPGIQRRSMVLSQWISATSGAWSDRCDQGRRGSTTGRCTEQLRT